MVDWIAQHPYWAGFAVFLSALAESLVVVGVIVPGALIMFGAGALVAMGALELWTTIAWAAAGAVAGDGISYWVGHHYREQLWSLWPFRRYPGLISRGEAFFQRHGDKSVLLGRFIGPVRPMIPAVAGMLGMPPLRFYAVNLLSALAWAPVYIFPGVVFGASLKLASAVAARLAAMFVAVALSLWVAISVIRRLVLWLPSRMDRALTVFQAWASSTPRPGWARKLVVDLLDPARPASRALLLLAAVLILGAWGFLGVLEDVITGDPLVRVDSGVYHLLHGLRTPLADTVMIALTELGDAAVTFPVVIVVLLWLVFRRAWRVAAYWLGAVAFAAALVPALKASLRLPRPVPLLYDGAYGFAFPSSHATMSLVIYGFLGVLLARELSARGRWLVFGVAVPLVGLIAFSRLYLGAHWLSDVLGGLAFGAAWVALLGIAYLRHPAPVLAAPGLAAASLLTLFIAGGAHIAARYPSDTERYAVRERVMVLTEQAWWESAWQALPAWRLDMEGEYEQPLTVQWAGSLESLREALRTHGWQTPSPFSGRNWLLLLDMTRPAMQLPVLPLVHDGRNEALALIHAVTGAADKRLVLRLWAAQAMLQEQAQPVWIGTVTQETIHRPLAWFNLPHDGNDYDIPREALRQALVSVPLREVQRRSEISRPQKGLMIWDGRILLARSPAQ